MMRRFLLGCGLLLLLMAGAVSAQEEPVTADEVNAVAKRLYCPVCENQPLDTCMTEACFLWREEIRLQLESGATSDQVVANFVAQFGERAVGAPLDPTLRTLTIGLPFVAAALALLVGVMTFARWRGRRSAPAAAAGAPPLVDDDYAAQVERDLRG